MKKLLAEFIGTFWLVLGGCGAAVIASGVENVGIGLAGVALAFGLTVLTGAYALGHISGGHFNPAVSVGLWMGGRFDARDLPGYIIAQVLGGILGAAILYLIISSSTDFTGFSGPGAFASNFYDANVYGVNYGLVGALVTEIVMTFMFLIVILGATHKNASPGFGGIAIGLALTLIHLISIPVTNTSVNPARSTSQALFVGGEALGQLWMFWVAPIVGAILAGLVYKFMAPNKN
ncbi:aquaporin Z [Xanthomarina sp. F2636L]|uniref:aquaporin Z n=1 Tax=Xanthomarina sp. F2636L TaxID=2996018 RepID=UPI00225DEFB6|nr:aquaporin Z [Xanthomarina sp. F2636L]MCX7551798.1 aquaporin Z [Xanthomarina sp. F2636L]